MKQSLAYANYLYKDNTDGYIQIMQMKQGKVCKMYNVKYDELWEVLDKIAGEEDVYITPNTFFIPKRRNENIRQFRALYIDIDLKKNVTINDAIQEVILLVADEKIPMPSMFVDSGRGLHLYWRIQDAPYQALDTWQALEDYLYYQLKHIGADAQATDAARVLRLPATKNSKNKKMCKILHINEEKYSMYELREKYLGWKPNKKAIHDISINKKSKVVNLYNSYSLHYTRLQDIIKLCELRKWRIAPKGNEQGKRNAFTHLYAYWQGMFIRDIEELKQKVKEFNSKFDIPLSDKEIEQVVRSVNKAIDKFIEWSNNKTPLQPGEKDKPGYWYSNARLIEILDITEEEMQAKDKEGNYILKTIISKQEKRRRDKEKKKKDRRNEEGLTKKQVEVIQLKNEVKRLRNEGLSYRAIAKELEISLGLVAKYVKQ